MPEECEHPPDAIWFEPDRGSTVCHLCDESLQTQTMMEVFERWRKRLEMDLLHTEETGQPVTYRHGQIMELSYLFSDFVPKPVEAGWTPPQLADPRRVAEQ